MALFKVIKSEFSSGHVWISLYPKAFLRIENKKKKIK